MSGVAVVIRWVGNPVTVAAGLVLAFNDHVLKAAWPGVVTGKLSDVAGLVVAPPLLGLAIGLVSPRLSARWLLWLAITATGLGFGLVKLTWTGAAVASGAWSLVAGPSYVLRDPSDLAALPALAVAWWSWSRSVRLAPADSVVAPIRALLALPFLLLAVTATSAANTPDRVTAVDERDGKVVILTGPGGAWSSVTGVSHWQRAAPLSWTRGPRRQECVPGEPSHCYRVHGPDMNNGTNQPAPTPGRLLGVDETVDGGVTWRTAWAVSPGRWRLLVREHGLWSQPADDLLASQDILVRLVPGGHQVIVANGVDGLAVRNSDGVWHRIGVHVGQFTDIQPRPLTRFGYGLDLEIAAAVVFIMLGLLLASSTTNVRIRRMYPADVSWPVLATSGFLGSLVWVAILAVFPVFFAGVVELVGVVGVSLAIALGQSALPRLRALALLAACLLVGAGFAGPYLGWTVGWPDSYLAASALAWTLTAVGLGVAVAVAWWVGGRPNPPRRWPPRPPVPPGPGSGPVQTSSGAPSKSTME